MDPGKLDKRIEFGYISKGKDKDGFLVQTWKKFRGCWASVKGLRGTTFYAAAQTQSENNKIFKCRYFKELKANMKIKYNNIIYDITSVNDLEEKHVEYEIHAKEVKPSG